MKTIKVINARKSYKLIWILRFSDIFKLTIRAVLPYKARHACAIVVIDFVYASPIV